MSRVVSNVFGGNHMCPNRLHLFRANIMSSGVKVRQARGGAGPSVRTCFWRQVWQHACKWEGKGGGLHAKYFRRLEQQVPGARGVMVWARTAREHTWASRR